MTNVDELKAAIEVELAEKNSEIAAIFQREFPGCLLDEPCKPRSTWSIENDVFSNYDGRLSRYLSMYLPCDPEAPIMPEVLFVFEFSQEESASFSEEPEVTISLQHIMVNCLFNSADFDDNENHFFIISDAGEHGLWDSEEPDNPEAYQRVASDLFKLLSGFAFVCSR